jgi:hypothetical protein
MTSPVFPRRQVLRFGAALSLGWLAGCRQSRAELVAHRGDLPKAWAAELPAPWQARWLEDPAAVVASVSQSPAPGLVQCLDGWATTVPANRLQPFGAPALLKRLEAVAQPVSRLYAPAGSAAVAFPWACSPWVLLLRRRDDLVPQATEDWDVLLDPSLKGGVVLPSSPRVVIDLVQGDPARLRRLRAQALAYDDRDGLNLLLTGEAEAAVLPRQRVLPLLRRDPRLRALLPATGSPLSWNLLLRPVSAQPAPPLDWLGAILEPPLLPLLLAAGSVPPLPRGLLEASLKTFPASIAHLLLPPTAVWERCRSLPPLTPQQQESLQDLWRETTPDLAPGKAP